MLHLLHIEQKKLLKYKTFWILTGLFFGLMVLVFFGVQGFINEVTQNTNTKSPVAIPEMSLYQFPDVWHNITFLAGYFKTILGIIFLILLTNEYTSKTIRLNIIGGLSRRDYFTGKALLMTALALALALLILVAGSILGFTNTKDVTLLMAMEKIACPFAYLAETICYLFFVFFIGTILRKAGLAIGLLLLYTYIIEPILSFKLPDKISPYLPLNAVGNIIQVPNTQLMRVFGVEFYDGVSYASMGAAAAWAVLFGGMTYYILKNKDL